MWAPMAGRSTRNIKTFLGGKEYLSEMSNFGHRNGIKSITQMKLWRWGFQGVGPESTPVVCIGITGAELSRSV